MIQFISQFRIFLKVVIFFMLCFPVLINYADAGTFPKDIQRILDKGKLVVAMYFEDVPPFFMFKKKGDFFGIDVELAKDMGKRLGVSVEFNRNAKTFDELIDMVAERRADIVISILSQTLIRAQKVRFSNPYIILHPALIINRLQAARQKRSKNPAIFLNHKSVSIGTIEGTSYVGFAKADYPEAQLILYKDWETASRDALEGNIFAAFYDEIEIKNWYKVNPEGAIYVQTLIRKDKKDPIAFAVHTEDTHFLSWLNLYLEIIKQDGTLSKLKDTYLKGEEWRQQ